MTELEVQRIAKIAADEAARKAIKETMILFGIDPDDPTAVQKDMAFIRSWREGTAAVGRSGLLTIVGVVIVAFMGLIWAAIKSPSL